MFLWRILSRGILIAQLIALLGCISSSGSSSSSGGGLISLDGVSALEFDDNGSATIDLSGADKSDEYLIALYSSENSQSYQQSFLINSLSAENSASLINSSAVLESSNETEDFHGVLRDWEHEIEDEPLPEIAENQSIRFSTLGSTKAFNVLISTTSKKYQTVTAELRYATDNFHAYVDVRDIDQMDDDRFDENLATFNSVIQNIRSLFGSESDVNDDGHFTILFTHAVNELGGISGGGIITGYFLASDLFSNSSYESSNEREITYMSVADPQGDYGSSLSEKFYFKNIMPAVLPHEFQHMINFNMHYFENDSSPEDSFLNEALSHLAEDIYTFNENGYMAQTGRENPSRVARYLRSVNKTCFSCGTSLAQRGGSYLFIRYLYEQAEKGYLSGTTSGSDFLNRLLDTKKRGVKNIVDAAAGKSGSTQSTYKQLLQLFSLAVYLSGSPRQVDERVKIDGINLRADQDDGRYTRLKGPAAETVSDFPFRGSLESSSAVYIKMKAEDILENGGSFRVDVSKGADIGGYVMKL